MIDKIRSLFSPKPPALPVLELLGPALINGQTYDGRIAVYGIVRHASLSPRVFVKSDDGSWYVQALPMFIQRRGDAPDWMFSVTCQCGFSDAKWQAGTGYVVKAVRVPVGTFITPGESIASIPADWPCSNELKVYRFNETFWK